MKLSNYQILKIKEFASDKHISYIGLRNLIEDLGMEFPVRGTTNGERYHHSKSGYRYISMENPATGRIELFNIDYNATNPKPHFSSLPIDHPAIVDGWDE